MALALRSPYSEEIVSLGLCKGSCLLAPGTSASVLDSCKQRWGIPAAEVLFNNLFYCLSVDDSSIGKSQLWSEPSEPEIQTERDSNK